MEREYKEEIWKSIGVYQGVDFTGCYEVSNKGRMRVLDRIIKYKSGKERTIKGHISNVYRLLLEADTRIEDTNGVHGMILN